MPSCMNKPICLSIGDINGIGIEILIKLWKLNKLDNFILVTNKKIFDRYLLKKKIILNYNELLNKNKKIFKIYNINAKNNYENTYKSLKTCYKLVKNNISKGIITLPLRKESINLNIDSNFKGQTEFFQLLDKKKVSNMIFHHKGLLITPITTHIKLRSISSYLAKKNFIYNKIISINETLKRDFNIKKPKIIISGINPHAGENGILGYEEIDILIPQIKRIKKLNINLEGPISADTMINDKNIKKYDCFVFIYHDQALIPFKILSKLAGVNYTGGLDIIRLSPDHGTAYDLVGKNKADPKSILNCFKDINLIHQNRKNFDNS